MYLDTINTKRALKQQEQHNKEILQTLKSIENLLKKPTPKVAGKPKG